MEKNNFIGGLLGLRGSYVEKLNSIIEKYDVDSYLLGELLVDSDYQKVIQGKPQDWRLAHITDLILNTLIMGLNGEYENYDLASEVSGIYNFADEKFLIWQRDKGCYPYYIGDYSDFENAISEIIDGLEKEKISNKGKEKDYDALAKELAKIVKKIYEDQYGDEDDDDQYYGEDDDE
jgi:hypothetical protein